MVAQGSPRATEERDDGWRYFALILQRLPTAIEALSTSSHFRGAMPFKGQVHFDITLLKCRIDFDALEKG